MNTDLPLHTKYRPQTLEEVVGNKSIVNSLQSVLSRDQGLPHVFLFTGPSGCGKTTLARIIKNELNCDDGEFLEYNAGNTRGIDTIRDIALSCRYKPLRGSIRIYMMDEAAKLTNDAQNALLKLLEDPPNHVFFILCTTEPEKLLPTIRTRCSIYQVSSLNPRDMTKLLVSVCQKEDIEITERILKEITRVSNGSPRQALVILDQVIDLPDEETAVQAIIDNTIDEAVILDVCKLLLENNPNTNKWEKMSRLLKGLDEDPEAVRLSILGYLNSVMLNSGSQRTADLMLLFTENFFYGGKGSLTIACWEACQVK